MKIKKLFGRVLICKKSIISESLETEWRIGDVCNEGVS